jgi:hypothetical protein
MTAMRSERFGAERGAAEQSGPERYAPPERRTTERSSEFNPAAANDVEGEIRDFVRRDIAFLRRQRSGADDEAVSDNLNSLMRRVSGASMDEIDRVILELQGVREMLRNEGERVSREIAGYASLSHAAMTAMKVIGDSLKQWKEGSRLPPDSERRPAG